MTPGICKSDHGHRFDPVSGWCLNGCGWREDGQSAYRPRTVRPPRELVDITEPRRGDALA